MERLIENFRNRLKSVSLEFSRSIIEKINWEGRLIGIRGAKGVGKTTLMLQYIKIHFPDDDSVLYASLDDLWFTQNNLPDMVAAFVKLGGKRLFLDEIHKYPSWIQIIKNIYDTYPSLKVVFTGSSLLDILDSKHDLSRRVDSYYMKGLSFREYLNLELNKEFRIYTLDDVVKKHLIISNEITDQISPLPQFRKYLRSGYYPFFRETPELYSGKLNDIITAIIDSELPSLRNVSVSHCNRLKKILMTLYESAPFVPNIRELSNATGIDRNTMVNYLNYLAEADLIRNLFHDASGITRLKKPDRIFPENTNLQYAFHYKMPEMKSINETFLANQLSYNRSLTITENGGLKTEDKRIFFPGEVPPAEREDISFSHENCFFAADDMEFGHGNRIPLWQFGFLY